MKQTPLIFLLLLIACFQSQAQDQTNNFNIESLEVPYQKFTLDNGLTLLVHEDHKAPIAAVNVWYHVGSKNEPEGKTGFAHLFEHLMLTDCVAI